MATMTNTTKNQPNKAENQEPKSQAEDADIPDLSKFDMGADFDKSDGLTVDGRIEGWYYFAAIETEEDRPDNLRNVLAMQYERCVKETCPICGEGTNMVLCRLPLEVWLSRRRAKTRRRLEARKPNPDAQNKARTISDIPQSATVHTNQPNHLRPRRQS